MYTIVIHVKEVELFVNNYKFILVTEFIVIRNYLLNLVIYKMENVKPLFFIILKTS